MKRLLVLCGGQSPEHLISVRSCKNVLSAIDRSKYEVTLIGINQSGEWRLIKEDEIGDEILTQGEEVQLKPGRKDPIWVGDRSLGAFFSCFPVLHGPNGEDGTIQGLLRMVGIAYVGPGVLGSSLCMDKDSSKRILQNEGIPVAPWKLLRKNDSIPSYEEMARQLGDVVFVKPSNMGSSVGVHRVANAKEWANAIEDAFKYDRKVLVEKSISGRELECAVMGNETPIASGVGEVKSGDFYSYDEKYASNSVAEISIPAEVNDQELAKLRNTAINVYKALECKGMSRIDMFLTSNGEVYLNEVNTIPGFTSISMYPKLWEHEGVGYTELIDRLIAFSVEK